VDEFLRIRLSLDQLETTMVPDAEQQLISRASISPFVHAADLDNDDDVYREEDPYQDDEDD
jgi:hypothetical protein